MDYSEARAVNLQNLIACKYTRDFPELLEKRAHLVFICDSLMFGCKDHNLIRSSSVNNGRAFTLNGFQLFIDMLNGLAIPLKKSDHPLVAVRERHDVCRIKGEVHLVETTAIPKLDTRMRNGIQFTRKRVRVIFPYRDHWMVDNGMFDETGVELPHTLQGPRHYVSDEKVYLLWVWMYIGIPDYWDNILTSFSFSTAPILEANRPWMDRYYRYPKPT